MALPRGIFDKEPLSQEDRDMLVRGPTGPIQVSYPTVEAWGRGWRQGAMVGTLVTTVLLGGAMAFLFFIDWLGKCA